MQRTEVTNAQLRDALQWAFDRGLIYLDGSSAINAEGDPQILFSVEQGASAIQFDGERFTVGEPDADRPCAINWFGALAYCNFESDRLGLEPGGRFFGLGGGAER